MSAADPSPPAALRGPWAWTALACGVAALACVVAAGVQMALARGPWIDEFATLWMSEPGPPLGEVVRNRLALDVHPPFYMLALRLVRTLAPGAGLVTLRLLDLAPLLAFAGYALAAAWRRPGRRALVAAAVVLALAPELFGGAMRSLRPYFMLMCASDALALAAALAFLDLRAGGRPARLELAVAAAATLVLMNGHYLAALATLLLAAGYALALARGGWRREAIAVLAAAALAGLPSAAFLLWRSAYMLGWTGGGFWIRTTTPQALAVMREVLLKLVGWNALAVAATALLWVRPRDDGGGLRAVAAVGLGASAAFLLILLLVNLHTNIVVDRYLLVLCGPTAVALAAGLAAWAPARPRLYLAALALSLATAAQSAWLHAHQQEEGWESTARLVAADVARCPGSRVDLFHWSDRYFNPLPTDREVRDYGYAWLAREHGFAAALNRPLASTDPRCPRILWGEHLGPALGLPSDMAILLKLLSGRNGLPPAFVRPDVTIQHGESGYVLVAPATPHP